MASIARTKLQPKSKSNKSRDKSTPERVTPHSFFDSYLKDRGSSLAVAEHEGSTIFNMLEMVRMGYKNQFATTAITFPCVDPVDGSLLGPGRVRYMEPPTDASGDVRKFNQPAGGMQPPYIAFNALGDWPSVVNDISVDLYVGEGETRALAFAEQRKHFISIGGVDAAFVGGTHRDKLLPWFDKFKWKGRRVYIVSDSDWFTNPNVRAAYTRLAALLTERGAVVSIIKWRHIFKEHEGADDLIGGGCFAVIERLCKIAPIWTEDSDAEWLEPKPFYNTLPAVPRLTEDMLPEALRGWLVDETYRLNVPLEYVAVPAIYALGLCVMTRAAIHPKSKDPWMVPGYLWFAMIAPSGSKKTAALSAALRPVYAIEAQLRDEATSTKLHHKAFRKYYETQLTEWEKQAQEDIKVGKTPKPFDTPEVPKEPPQPRQLFWSSLTVEALQVLLANENTAGAGYMRDELNGLLEDLEKPGREGDRAFLIEGTEAGSYKSGRIGRGQTYVAKNAVALGGGIQPQRLEKMILDGVRNGASNDGLLPRLALAVYPDPIPEPDIAFINEHPEPKAYQRALDLYKRLDALDHKNPEVYKFDEQAQKLFGEWYVHSERYRRTADLPEIVKSHLAKYDRLIAVLALFFKLCEKYDPEKRRSMKDSERLIVDQRHLETAFRWAAFLEGHALRMYHVRMTLARSAAHTVAEKIRQGRLKTDSDGTFTLHDIYENGWGGLNRAEETRQVVDILIDYGWVREEAQNTAKRAGRPPARYRLNPKITSSYPEVGGTKVEVEPANGDGNKRGLRVPGSVLPVFYGQANIKNKGITPHPLKTRKSGKPPEPSIGQIGQPGSRRRSTTSTSRPRNTNGK